MHFDREMDFVLFVSFFLYLGLFLNLINLIISTYQLSGVRRIKFGLYNMGNFLAIMVLIFISTYASIIYSYGINYASPGNTRYLLLFTIINRIAFIYSLKKQKDHNIYRIIFHSFKLLPMILFLPIFDSVFSLTFTKALFYLISILIIDENISLCVRLSFNIRNNITFASLIEAFEKVDMGAVFAKMNGKIVMVNSYAEEIFKRVGYSRISSMNDLYKKLSEMNDEYEFENLEYEEGSSIIRFKNGQSYKLVERKITVSKRQYIELDIHEVTSLDRMVRRLSMKNDELEKVNAELIKMIDGIDQIILETETLNLRHKVHDIIGKRLSIIVAATQEMEMIGKSTATEEQLYSLLNNMINDLKSEHLGQFTDRLTHLVESFKVIGVDLIVSGDTIHEEHLNDTITSIYRESTTNAIRHANANKVFMNVIDEGDKYTISIWDNGITRSKEIIEGTGLKGIRKSVDEVGGRVDFLMDEFFTIRIVVKKPI